MVPTEADLTAKAKKADLTTPELSRTTIETMETITKAEITKETDKNITAKASAITSVMIITTVTEIGSRATNNRRRLTTLKKKPRKILMMNY